MSRLRARPSSRRAGTVRRALARPARRALAAAIACLAALAVTVPARAALLATLVSEVGGVGILSPDAADPVINEAIARLRAELRLVGLEGALIGCDAAGAEDARACAPDSSAERAAVPEAETPPPSPGATRAGVARAIIALAREDGVVTIEVIEKLLNGSKFFRLVYVPTREGGDDPAVLAVRGVELLRDLHMDVERNRPVLAAAPARPPIVVATPAAPPRTPGPWRLGALAGLLQGREGLGPRVAPVLTVSRAFGPHWAVTLLASGPYYQDLTSANPGEHTSTRQELAMLGFRGTLPTGRVSPFAMVAAGALHLAADGHSDDVTAMTHQRSLWSALLGAGVGAAFAVNSVITVVAEADALTALPAGRITIRDQVVGLAGAPSALVQLGVWAALF